MTKRRPEAPWVVLVQGSGGLCQRCGATLNLSLAVGMLIDDFVKFCDDFTDVHAECAEVYRFPASEMKGQEMSRIEQSERAGR